MATIVVSICHHDGRSTRTEKLRLFSEQNDAQEMALLLGALFEIPSHERVVGLASVAGSCGVIPLSASCRYPNLIFRDEERLGHIFRIVTKDAASEDEVLFPISALTPPPSPGLSRLPPTWASSPPELRVSTAETVAVPELVSTGALTRQQGVLVVEMLRAEDPVVFAACRVAGAAGVSLGSSTPAGERRREWSGEAKGNFASMVKVVLGGKVGRGDGGSSVGEANGGMPRRGVKGRGRGRAWGEEEEEQQRCRGSQEVPESFQMDALALADVALATGKISKQTYVRALHKVVTLDSSLVSAYLGERKQGRQEDGEGMLEAVLRAFGPEQQGRAADDDYPRQQPLAAAAVGGVKAATGATADGSLGQGRMAAEDLVAREAELRDDFLRQALSLIEEGSAGLSAQHRAVVEKAISVGHPWVSAIYDECKETGDVRGLMQNLQCLPALLERDQAAVLAANTSQPPPPGEADSPFWPRRQQQPQQQQQQRQQPQPQHHHQRQQQQQQPHQQQQPRRQHEQEPQPSVSRTVLSAKSIPLASVSSISASTPAATATAASSEQVASASTTPANSSSASTQAVNAAEGPAAVFHRGLVDGGTVGHGKGEAGNPAFDMVVGQLCRVVAGCSQLLRLRGVIGEREERALKTMSNRGSPVLLAAVEAYGANQDLEDLLDTLQTAAEIELSLTAAAPPSATAAAAAAVPETRRADPPQQRRTLPHQQQQQQQQPSGVVAGGGRGGLDLGYGSGVSRDGGGRAQASVGVSSNGESGDGCRDGDATGESIWSRPAAEVKTPAAAAAVGARAQELMKARFAGMKSAAEAKSAAAAAAAAETGGSVEGSKSASSAASSFGKEGKEPSGDRRLRQDVSQLVAVMAKQGMLTDRQRLFLLAQVGRRITRTTREKHAQYLATGNSKELYTVLVALSMPPSRKKEKDKPGAGVGPRGGQEDNDDDDTDDDDDDDDDEAAWDEESGEEASEEEEEEDEERHGEKKREREMIMEKENDGTGKTSGPGDFGGDEAVGGGVVRQGASEGGEPQQAFEACDAPEL
ncbi:unnamed protein product [Ectocarpus sp. 12 AP-2014]